MNSVLKNLLKNLVINSSILNYAALAATAKQLAVAFGWGKEEAEVEAVIRAAEAQDAKAILNAVGDLLKLVALRLPSHGQPKVVAATSGIEVGFLHDAIENAFDESTIAIARDTPPVEAISPGTVIEIIKLIDILVTWIRDRRAKQ